MSPQHWFRLNELGCPAFEAEELLARCEKSDTCLCAVKNSCGKSSHASSSCFNNYHSSQCSSCACFSSSCSSSFDRQHTLCSKVCQTCLTLCRGTAEKRTEEALQSVHSRDIKGLYPTFSDKTQSAAQSSASSLARVWEPEVPLPVRNVITSLQYQGPLLCPGNSLGKKRPGYAMPPCFDGTGSCSKTAALFTPSSHALFNEPNSASAVVKKARTS